MSASSATAGAGTPAPAVRLRGVEKRFGVHWALREVDLTVARGSLCGLVGPNGAGKTTTMRILATDLDPTAGEVEVLGLHLPRDAGALRPRLGYMPDSAGLYEELTLEEYLGYFASFYGLRGKARSDAVGTTIELAGVGGLARRRLLGLSKGERQRVLLARSLIHDPELLILDEPADGLDPRGRVELRELLLLLHERGTTILLSSHILADLEEICTDLALVDGGRVLYSGSRERLLATGAQLATIVVATLGGFDARVVEIARLAGFAAVDEPRGSTIAIEGPADEAAAGRLLRELVTAGVEVVSFDRRPDSLEAVYLRLTEAREQ